MRIALKADGGAAVGLGHMGRCAALGQAFAKLGHEPVFIDVPADCRAFLDGLGLRRGAGKRWDVLVADSYRLKHADYARLRRSARTLVVIDDLGTCAADCDWVLNGHVDAFDLEFRAKGAGRLLGPKFVLLRREYWKPAKPREFAGPVKRLLISVGGCPTPHGLDRAVAAAKRALPDAELHVVGGKPSRRTPGVVVHGRLPSLRPLLEHCDAALSAGGQVLYELAFTGTPAVVIELAKNQAGNARGMDAAGSALNAGRPGTRGFDGKLTRLLRRLDDPARRAQMSAAGRMLVDGRGALRVAERLTRGASNGL